ncbi:MAG: hypothetical protein E5Y63_19700 [Mesorhizobium sp.]|uniref:hypothetical protein n=1 Tax=Mesorhizobium sp. TaxID=1871066 RepID=UPI000FE78555|nr:hypothetical protein [Mesorhizobium sp.]RWP59490.1 MAG: hypothetical protein EOR08_23320 [Mesorhizobium sp.]TIM28526.1 MAG: hypothetical protein E5Y63_19700 [Mesorhizobium sp.]TIM60250.1 MAG: hypothetical protein E5Y58_34440 [Mesorhizobium sp.]
MLKNIQDRLAFSRLVNHAADAGIAARGWTAAFRMGEASAKSVRACLRRCHGNPETRAILKNVKAGDRVKSFG